jgi:hypothetical protein
LQSVSIKSFIKSGNPSESQVEETNGESYGGKTNIDSSWENPFSPEQLQKAWNGYAHQVETSNPRLFSMLTARSPRLKGQNVIIFPLQNETQEVELMKAKTALFDYLRGELKHAKLQLEVECVKEDRVRQKAFTASDKYKVLADKNPLLERLKNVFNLDLE